MMNLLKKISSKLQRESVYLGRDINHNLGFYKNFYKSARGSGIMIAINELKKLAHKLGLKGLQFHASPGTILHALFADRFTSRPSFPVTFMDLAGIPIEKIKFTAADIDTF